MANTKIRISIGVLCFAFMSCSGSYSIQSISPSAKAGYRTAYIVDSRASTVVGYTWVPMVGLMDGDKSKHEPVGNTPQHIQRALERHGIRAAVGTDGNPPGNVDLVVVYEDEWQWDLKMFLRELKIRIYDARSQKLVGSGSYECGSTEFHDFPTSEREAPIIIDSILKGQ